MVDVLLKFGNLRRKIKNKIFGKGITIFFKKRITFEHDSPEEFFTPFEHLFTQENVCEVVFDVTQSEFIYPSSLFFLLSIIETFKNKYIDFQIKLSVNSPVHAYLRYCGCNKFLNLPDLTDSSGDEFKDSKIFDIHQYDTLRNTERIAEKLTGMFVAEQPLSPLVEGDLCVSIDEILRNIKQHSNFTNSLVIGQTYPTSKRIRLVFYDNGIGIKKHLTRYNYSDIHPNLKRFIDENTYNNIKASPANGAIEHAARYNVSATNYEDNSGAGLDFIINDLSKPCDGSVIIISEDGYVKWQNGTVEKSFSFPYRIKGTLVCVTMNVDHDYILKYRSEAMEGENENGK